MTQEPQRPRRTCWGRVLDASTSTWDRDDAYPIERLFAFSEYCQSTPVWRVALVLLLTCATPLVLLVFFDSLPLRPPSEGWSASGFFFLRNFLGAHVIVGGILVQIQTLVLDQPLSRKKIIFIMCVVSIGHTSTLVLVAKYWAFPIPFMSTLGNLPFTVFLNVSMLLAIGTKDRQVLAKITKFNNIIAVQTTMLLVYPGFNAIFLKLDHLSQIALAGLLPIIKVSYKYVVAKVSSDLGDLSPAIIASVDLFDALYTTKCMQSASSFWVGFAIILFDVVQNCIAIASLSKQFHVLRRADNSIANRNTSQLLLLIPRLVTKKQLLLTAGSIRVSSRNTLKLSPQAQAKVDLLRALQSVEAELTMDSTSTGAKKHSNRTVVPLETVSASAQPSSAAKFIPDIVSATPVSVAARSGTRKSPSHLIRNAARLLHQSESVVLVEYIETAVPVFYAIYLLILVHLPNAKYYPEMQHLLGDADQLQRVVVNILLFACLELLSLVFVNEALKRTFGFSAFYQLAFTLESEWYIYQSNFISWILMIFPFLLLHNGTHLSNGFSLFDMRF